MKVCGEQFHPSPCKRAAPRRGKGVEVGFVRDLSGISHRGRVCSVSFFRGENYSTQGGIYHKSGGTFHKCAGSQTADKIDRGQPDRAGINSAVDALLKMPSAKAGRQNLPCSFSFRRRQAMMPSTLSAGIAVGRAVGSAPSCTSLSRMVDRFA
jgi:hypothetical protein